MIQAGILRVAGTTLPQFDGRWGLDLDAADLAGRPKSSLTAAEDDSGFTSPLLLCQAYHSSADHSEGRMLNVAMHLSGSHHFGKPPVAPPVASTQQRKASYW